jgi:hypothetical protein
VLVERGPDYTVSLFCFGLFAFCGMATGYKSVFDIYTRDLFFKILEFCFYCGSGFFIALVGYFEFLMLILAFAQPFTPGF